MAKFYGAVGFSTTVDKGHGVWGNEDVERMYYGDILRNYRRYAPAADGSNDNVTLSNSISILLDEYALDNAGSISYVEYAGSKWKVSSVEIEYPRMTLEFSEVYNG